MALPTLTPEQRQEAQAASLRARKARSELLAAVKNGEVTLAEVLERGQNEPVAGRTRVLQLIKALPKIGAVKAAKILDEADVPEEKKVQGLGVRQREALLRETAA